MITYGVSLKLYLRFFGVVELPGEARLRGIFFLTYTIIYVTNHRHDINEVLFKVALNTTTLSLFH
jgi:hypothetical protein